MSRTKLDNELGDWPIVVARNYEQFKTICRALGLNPSRTTSALNLRSMEGTRPTSVIYGPGWQKNPDWMEISGMLDRVVVKMRVRPRVKYLDESDLR